MKKWENAVIEEVDVRATAFGIKNPEKADSDKTQVSIGGADGWQQLFGEENDLS